MANGMVMGMVLKDVPGDLPKVDNCMSLCSCESAMPSVQDKSHLWSLVSRVLGTCWGTHWGDTSVLTSIDIIEHRLSLSIF